MTTIAGKYTKSYPFWTCLALIPAYCLSSAVFGEDQDVSPGNFGGAGLLEMPNARFFADGTVGVGVNFQKHAQRYFAVWQATPWLETTIGYRDDDQRGVDRSLDIKLRLWQEGNYRPAIAVGLRDALGNGHFSSEYIVASKRLYDLDFTLGLGWGYLGSRGGVYNLFRIFDGSFNNRDMSETSSGKIRFGNYFSGKNMAFFGGVEYHTPLSGLTLKLEYNSADISALEYFSPIPDKTAFNFGVNYKPTSWLDLAVGYDRGDAVTFRLTFKQNIHTLKFGNWSRGHDPAPIKTRDIPPTPQTGQAGRRDKIFTRLEHMGYLIEALEVRKQHIYLRLRRTPHAPSDNLAVLGAVLYVFPEATLDFGTETLHATEDNGVARVAVKIFKATPTYAREFSSSPARHQKIAGQIMQKMAARNLAPLSVSIGEKEASVHKKAGPYPEIPKNAGRTARLLTSELPDSVELFTIISEIGGEEVSRISLLRGELEKAHTYQSSPEELYATSVIADPEDAAPPKAQTIFSSKAYPAFTWDIRPNIQSHFGGNRDGKFRADVGVELRGNIEITRHLHLHGAVSQHIFGNLDQIPPAQSTTVPAVRSDIAHYSRAARTALSRLKLDYVHKPARNIHTRLSAGLLEAMFAGISGEVLYRPYDKNLAFGADLNWVKQRAFNQLLSLRDYQTLSGHVSLYHENTKYDITSILSAGRYLAGDWGAGFDVSRRFANGIRIGLHATFTDMSSQDFGDGSFDKGIYMTIPLDMFWIGPDRDNMRLDFRNLGKNGGQRLDPGTSLYNLLSDARKDRLVRDWHKILD